MELSSHLFSNSMLTSIGIKNTPSWYSVLKLGIGKNQHLHTLKNLDGWGIPFPKKYSNFSWKILKQFDEEAYISHSPKWAGKSQTKSLKKSEFDPKMLDEFKTVVLCDFLTIISGYPHRRFPGSGIYDNKVKLYLDKRITSE